MNRRHLLAGATAIPAALALPVAGAPSDDHADAELLALGRRFLEIRNQLHSLPSHEDPNYEHPLWDEKDDVVNKISKLTPRTAAGISVLLWVAYDYLATDRDDFHGATNSSEFSLTLVWKALQAGEGMGVRSEKIVT